MSNGIVMEEMIEELESVPSQEDCTVDIIKVNQGYNGSTLLKDSNRQQQSRKLNTRIAFQEIPPLVLKKS